MVIFGLVKSTGGTIHDQSPSSVEIKTRSIIQDKLLGYVLSFKQRPWKEEETFYTTYDFGKEVFCTYRFSKCDDCCIITSFVIFRTIYIVVLHQKISTEIIRAHGRISWSEGWHCNEGDWELKTKEGVVSKFKPGADIETGFYFSSWTSTYFTSTNSLSEALPET